MNSGPQPEAWSIREAAPDDAQALSLIGAASFLETYAGHVDGDAIMSHCAEKHSAEAYRQLLEADGRAWLVELEPRAAPIGYAVTCSPDLEQALPGDRELLRIYVLSRFQGTGIAKALLNAVVVASCGHERLLLGVKNDNHRALAFYRKHGFTQVGTRTFCVGSRTYDDFVLARPLNH